MLFLLVAVLLLIKLGTLTGIFVGSVSIVFGCEIDLDPFLANLDFGVGIPVVGAGVRLVEAIRTESM